jgi:hypothetical protein
VLRASVLAVFASGCVLPFALPPLRAETGATATINRPVAAHAGGGVALASGTLAGDQPVDVGVGGFADWNDDGVTAKGIYADTALFVERGRTTRTAIGARAEFRWDTTMPLDAGSTRGFAAKLRVDHEFRARVKAPYAESGSCGLVVGAARGTGAIGVYAEAGHAWLPGDERAFTATAGITVRVPMTAGLIAGIPGCR